MIGRLEGIRQKHRQHAVAGANGPTHSGGVLAVCSRATNDHPITLMRQKIAWLLADALSPASAHLSRCPRGRVFSFTGRTTQGCGNGWATTVSLSVTDGPLRRTDRRWAESDLVQGDGLTQVSLEISQMSSQSVVCVVDPRTNDLCSFRRLLTRTAMCFVCLSDRPDQTRAQSVGGLLVPARYSFPHPSCASLLSLRSGRGTSLVSWCIRYLSLSTVYQTWLLFKPLP